MMLVWCAILATLLFLGGCASTGPAPVGDAT